MKKNNKPLTIILLIIIIGLVVFIAYDKYNNKNNNLNNNAYNYKLENRKEIQEVEIEWISVLSDKKGDVYMFCDKDISNALEPMKTNLDKLSKKYAKYQIDNYINDDGKEEKLEAYKLDLKNILSMYTVHMGNGDNRYFIFLKEDGTISYINYYDIIYNGKINIKNIEGLNNVVSVLENYYTMTPYVITSNGTEVSLYDYIK